MKHQICRTVLAAAAVTVGVCLSACGLFRTPADDVFDNAEDAIASLAEFFADYSASIDERLAREEEERLAAEEAERARLEEETRLAEEAARLEEERRAREEEERIRREEEAARAAEEQADATPLPVSEPADYQVDPARQAEQT